MSEEDIASRLFGACKSGDVQALKQLVGESGYVAELLQDTHVPDRGRSIGEKTIFAAALSGHVDVVKLLLKEGVNVNVTTNQGSPIFAATKNGHLNVVLLLLEWGAEFRHIKGGFSPVFAACLEGHLDILKLLVKRGGVGVLNIDNPPLVVLACTKGHLEVLKYLLHMTNFDINRTFKGKDVQKEERDSLLFIACGRGQANIIQYLVSKGAVVTKGTVAKFPKLLQGALEQNLKEVELKPPDKGASQKAVEACWSGLKFTDVPPSLFTSLSSTLVSVDLSGNILESVPEEMFTLPLLQSLNLSSNRLTELTSEDCKWYCNKLRDVDITRNQLSSLPSALFSLPEIATVVAAYNLLSALPGDPASGVAAHATWNCEKLRKLDVSHNHLRSLPDCFQNMRNLKSLKISYNNISELPLSLCWGAVCLVSLDASHNKLTDLPLGAPNYWMLSCENLLLAHNLIETISSNITELTRLNTLNLSYNKISTLPSTVSWTCDRLVRLDLSHNSLTVLSHSPGSDQQYAQSEDDTKKGGLLQKFFTKKQSSQASPRTELEERELPHEKWKKCLQILILGSNNLLWLPDYIGQLSSLTKLDLSNNPQLKDLPLQLGFLKNCWELNLNGLNLTKIPPHLRPAERKATTKQLLAFLRAQKRQCKPYNRMKLMVVGLQGRGKTTLLSSLRDRNATLPENISTVGVVLNEWTCVSRAQKRDPVVFSTWDLAGQEVYYATHQCFLSRNTLYLAVWNMAGGEKEIKALRPWLLNIQARAPYSPVIVVGTHLDKLPSGEAPELRGKYRMLIEKIYRQPGGGYPDISDIIEVSAVTKEGLGSLHEAIYRAAISARDPDTKEKVIGQQVPSSYLYLQKVLEVEVAQRRESGVPPVLTQEEFTRLTDKIPENDILDDEDLALAAQFLHDNGVLLHYNDHLRGLNNLYFIDPAWLCDMLAEVIAVPEKGNFIRHGILAEANVAFLFRDTKKFPPQYLSQYLQLLERFEIALSLGDGTRLIPSMLSVDSPAFNFTNPPPPVLLSKLKPGEIGPPVCIKRRYLMVYVPSGFWSRLITRIIINLKRTGLVDPSQKRVYRDAVYWRRGIYISFNGGKFLVQAIESASLHMDYLRSMHQVADGVPELDDLQGLELTVWSNDGDDYSAVGYIVDQVESLIDEWFPGLKNTDPQGQVLFEREAIWVVPAHLRKKRFDPDSTNGSITSGEEIEEEIVFKLEDCALQARKSRTMYNAEYDTYIPLDHLVPELLLTDLPDEFKMNTASLEYNPDDFSTLLGVGGAGAVYRGKYNGKSVAIKRFLTLPEAERIYEKLECGVSRRSSPPVITNVEALQLFKDVRQEVTVLSCLDSPFVVKLLGVCLDPLFMATELAPQGSLFSLLEKRREVIQTQQGETAVSQIPKMPGGVLGYEITARISIQVAIALSYLHEQGIVYRDLKGDNVLVWSIDPSHTVNVKLADYGISRFANPGGVKGEEGTPGYMAPEALKKRGEDQSFDEKVDIFAYAMFLYELMTGVRTFEEIENVSDINRLVLRGERPRIFDYNADPVFPSMEELMFDCWKQAAADRPSANQVISRLSEPGFLCRKHCITNVNRQPLPKVSQIYAIPKHEDQVNVDFNSVWMWSKQDSQRNFSILNASRGVFTVVEKVCEGGRVYCMTSTGEVHKRLWAGTAGHEIHVFEQGPNLVDSKMMWTYTLKKGDSVLDLTTEVSNGRVTRVFAALANGCVWVFSRQSITGPVPEKVGGAVKRPDLIDVRCMDDQNDEEAYDWLDPQVLQVSESKKPPNCLQIVKGKQLWCGCGNTIVVVDISKMEKIKEFTVFSNKFHLVYQLVTVDDRVWVRGRQLPSVIEYNATTFEPLWKINCEEIDPSGKYVCEQYTTEEDTQIDEPFPEPKPLDQPQDSDQLQFQVEKVPNFLRPGGRSAITSVRYGRSLKQRRERLTSISIQKLGDLRTKRHGGTRVTSLLLVRNCLWIGRGMGDILVVDVSKEDTKGRVLARLALDDTETYGNKSSQFLVLVNNEFVVATQYLAPLAPKSSTTDVPPRQQVTVWDAWTRETILQFNRRTKAVLDCGGISLTKS